MKEKLQAIKEYVGDNKKDLLIAALGGFSIGMVYNYIKLERASLAVINRYDTILRYKNVMLKNDKIMIDTQAEFIKFLQK